MVRFILHTILILVVSQLTNVAMGLMLTESEQVHLQHILVQAEKYFNGQNLNHQQSNNCIFSPGKELSLQRTKLPLSVRVLVEGIQLSHKSNQNNDSYVTPNDAQTSLERDYKYHFHELCRLRI